MEQAIFVSIVILYNIYIYNYNIYAINTIYNMQILERERQKGEGVGGRESKGERKGGSLRKGRLEGGSER